jgi:tetratricopeptide (TPR) repeat protein
MRAKAAAAPKAAAAKAAAPPREVAAVEASGVAGLDAALRAAVAASPQADQADLVKRWETAHRGGVDDLKALRRFAFDLRRDQRAALARSLIESMVQALPDYAPLWTLLAELANKSRDPAEALRLGNEIHKRFPQSPHGPRVVLEAQLKLGELDDAAATLKNLPEAVRHSDWAFQAAVALAERRQDYAAMLDAAVALDKFDPERPDGLIGQAAALARLERWDDARRTMDAALEKFPRAPGVLRQAAITAEQAGDMDRALQHWADIRTHFGDTNGGYNGALRTLARFRRLDLAMPLLNEGLEKFPDDIDLVVWAGEMAFKAGSVDDGDYYWKRAMKLRPDNPQYALNAATALIGQPAGRRKRMGEVMRRLEAHHEAFPDYAPAYTAHISAYRETRELEEADRRSATWCERFPNDTKLWLARAGILEDQKRFGDAVRVIAELRERRPEAPDIEAAYIRALSCAGRYEDAEAACEAALQRDPKQRRLLTEYARIASRRGVWAEALRRLLEAQKHLPDDEALLKDIQNVRLQLDEPEAAESKEELQNNLFARFESLGGTGAGCEFGIVQRRLGNDSIGLLRWSRNDTTQLIAALDCEFEGVGEAENTVLRARRLNVDAEEWVTSDKRFLMESHTFVRTADAPEDKMFAQTCRRLRFLRGKMLQDLRAADKMYVFKALQPLGDEDIRALHAALARYGDNALLCVMRADKVHKRGTLRDLGRGVYAGYIGHFMKDNTGNPGFDIPGWKMVCTEADARWAATRPERAISEAA